MDRLIKWSIRLDNNYAIFESRNLLPNESFDIRVYAPNGRSILWRASEINDSLLLNSGFGYYTFVPSSSNCDFLPSHLCLDNCKCSLAPVDSCDIQIVGPTSTTVGATSRLTFTGLAPSTLASIRVASTLNEVLMYSVMADSTGKGIFEFTYNVAGTYSFTVASGLCISAPFQLVIQNATNDAQILQGAIKSCQGAVSSSITFNRNSYKFDESGTATIEFCNKTGELQSITPKLDLNFSLILNNLPPRVELPPGICKSYSIFFKAPITPTTLEMKVEGGYICGENAYSILNSSQFVAVESGSSTGSECSAVVSNFVVAPDPTDPAKLVLKLSLKNVGITQLKHFEVILPGDLDPKIHITVPTGFAPLSPGQPRDILMPIFFDEAGSYQINLPYGSVKYGCYTSANLSILQNLFATYVKA